MAGDRHEDLRERRACVLRRGARRSAVRTGWSRTTAFVLPLTCLAAIAVAVSSYLMAATAAPATRPAPSTAPARAPAKATNPHWNETECRECHEMRGERPRRIPEEKIEAVCVKCHDGVRARREPHPVGRSFGPGTVRPEKWPAPDGKVTCVTCHDIRESGHRTGGRPSENPFFLRGPSGNTLAFCGACHVSAAREGRHNPHQMLSANGQIDESACRFCHTWDRIPENRTERTGQPGLRQDVILLCMGCHGQHVDWFDPGHIGHSVSARRRGYMVAREDTPTAEPVTAAARQAAAQSGREPEQLPLAPNDRIICSTCHNPHQAGVFPAGSILGLGASTQEDWRASRHRLRGMGKELCRGCHEK